jgi:hypothetical protein
MKITRSNIIIGSIVFLIFLSIFLYTIRKDNKKIAALNKEYPLLKFEDSIKGRVSSKYDWKSNGFRRSGIVSNLIINDYKHRIIADDIRGFHNSGIDMIISVGDSVFKKQNNDTIKVLKEDGKVNILLRRDKLYEN